MDFIWFHYIMNGEKGGMGHVFGVRVDGAAPRGFLRFLSLTAFQAEGGGGGFAADFKEKGRGSAAGCVEGLHRFAQGGATALTG